MWIPQGLEKSNHLNIIVIKYYVIICQALVKMRLTVLYEDILGLSREALSYDVLIAVHHVGAEDPLIMFHADVDAGLPHVSFQHPGTTFLKNIREIESVLQLSHTVWSRMATR